MTQIISRPNDVNAFHLEKKVLWSEISFDSQGFLGILDRSYQISELFENITIEQMEKIMI